MFQITTDPRQKQHLTNKEALTVLCSVVKRARKQLEHERSVEGNTSRLGERFSLLLQVSGLRSVAFAAQSELMKKKYKQQQNREKYGLELLLARSKGNRGVFWQNLMFSLLHLQCYLVSRGC